MAAFVFGARDLRALCSMGPLVSFGGVSTYADDGSPVRGLFDRPIGLKLMGEGIGGVENPVPELRLPCNAFNPMPANGDTVTLTDAASGFTADYTVYQPTAEDDGAFLCYELHAVSLP